MPKNGRALFCYLRLKLKFFNNFVDLNLNICIFATHVSRKVCDVVGLRLLAHEVHIADYITQFVSCVFVDACKDVLVCLFVRCVCICGACVRLFVCL